MRWLMTSAQSAVVQVQLYSTVETLSGNWSPVAHRTADRIPACRLQPPYTTQSKLRYKEFKANFLFYPALVLFFLLTLLVTLLKTSSVRFTVLNPPGLLYSTVRYVVRLLCRMYVFITNNTFTTNTLGVIFHKTCCNNKIYTN